MEELIRVIITSPEIYAIIAKDRGRHNGDDDDDETVFEKEDYEDGIFKYLEHHGAMILSNTDYDGSITKKFGTEAANVFEHIGQGKKRFEEMADC